jgi:rfaE bifunctional protein nucleotidyltransferase chain/domain
MAPGDQTTIVVPRGVVSIGQAARAARRWQRSGQTVVLTNGCFDLLHVGHARYLAAARSIGHLIVGVNSDDSVRSLKGPSRPIVSALDRAELLASLRSVDLVTIFDDLTAERLVEEVRPDVYVKGADYDEKSKPLPEAAVADRIGTRVAFIALTPGRSTSALVGQILGVRS